MGKLGSDRKVFPEKKCSAHKFVWGQKSARNVSDRPAGKSGLFRMGVIGPCVEEMW